jgi:hypothetical protein
MLVGLTFLFLAGCRGENQTFRPVIALGDSQVTSAQAVPSTIERRTLQIYTIDLPAGELTDNPELWRQLDETALGVAEHDVLWANGLRVGTGPQSRLVEVARVLGIEDAPSVTLLSPDATPRVREFDRGSADNAGPGRQTLFWFDERKQPRGYAYLNSRNFLSISFSPTPGRRDDSVRIVTTPVVRSERGRKIVRRDNEEFVIRDVRDEAIFDLALSVDVPDDGFVLIAPSPEADRRTSIGHAFLLADTRGTRNETAFLIVPQTVTLERVP